MRERGGERERDRERESARQRGKKGKTYIDKRSTSVSRFFSSCSTTFKLPLDMNSCCVIHGVIEW